MDSTCPYCKEKTDHDEVFDGEHFNCTNCGRLVCAVAYTDDTISLIGAEPPPLLTGRQRTRMLWRKQGRR